MAGNKIAKRQTILREVTIAAGDVVNAITSLVGSWDALSQNSFTSGTDKYVDTDLTAAAGLDFLSVTDLDNLGGVVTRLKAFVSNTGTLSAGDFTKLVLIKQA